MMSNTVWKAKCLTNNQVVAVKLIDLATFNAQALDSIKKEIQIMYWANHPNIVEFYSAFIDGSKLWLVMKLLEGSALDVMRWCKPNGFEDEKTIATILYQVLLGLKYLHANRKMHRDIKAANILLDSDGMCMLGDFTVAAILNEHEEKRFTFVGTPCWMAPEVVDIDKCARDGNFLFFDFWRPGLTLVVYDRHKGYDVKADIWSLGVTAIELALGKPPHADKQPMQVVMAIVELPSPALDNPDGKATKTQMSEAKEKWSAAFRDFVAKCCQKDPRKRYASKQWVIVGPMELTIWGYRPTASQLLKHKFFALAEKPDFLVKEVLYDLPPLIQRFKVLEDRRKAKEAAQFKQLSANAEKAARRVSLSAPGKIVLDLNGGGEWKSTFQSIKHCIFTTTRASLRLRFTGFRTGAVKIWNGTLLS